MKTRRPNHAGRGSNFGRRIRLKAAGEHKRPIDLLQSAEFDPPDPGDRLQPAERGFDARARMQTHRVARVPRGTPNRTAAGPVRFWATCAVQPSSRVTSTNSRISYALSAERVVTSRRALPLRLQHQQPRVALGSAIGLSGHRLDDQAMAILDQLVAEVRQPRPIAVKFAIQFGVGISGDAWVLLVRV